MQDKSEVEQFYAAICSKLGITRHWHELSPQEVAVFLQGVNMILAVVHNAT